MSGPEQRLVNISKVGKISERESFPSFTRPIHLHPLLCPWTCGGGDLVGYMGAGGGGGAGAKHFVTQPLLGMYRQAVLVM